MSNRGATKKSDTRDSDRFSRRSALIALGAGIALTSFEFMAASAQSRSQPGVNTLNRTKVNEIVRGGGTLVVAEWEAKEGQAEAVSAILQRFLPQAQSDPGVKLFLIARGKNNPAQFLFYELFVDDAAVAAHRASEYFKTMIAGEALPLLSKRESTEYSLL
jgi:quinol monooxygenase YgiN